MSTILADTWGSVVVLTQGLVNQFKQDYPGVPIQFHDWEAHSNVAELPDADLIGPMSLGITEESPELIEASFAIGISTYQGDKNLFRLREFVGRAFERLRFGQSMTLFDARTAAEKGMYHFASGTILAPMSKADARPFQYCQAVALLNPGK